MNKNKEELLKKWLKLKKAEDKAKKERNLIEKEIAKMYVFEEKSKTFNEDELDLKINIKKNIVYKLDQKIWLEKRAEIPENLRPEKVSFSLDVKGFEYLKENEKKIYKKVSDCVTISENKPTIKIEKI